MFKHIDTYEEYLRWWPTGLLWMKPPTSEWVPMCRVGLGATPVLRGEFRWELQAGFHYAIKLEA